MARNVATGSNALSISSSTLNDLNQFTLAVTWRRPSASSLGRVMDKWNTSGFGGWVWIAGDSTTGTTFEARRWGTTVGRWVGGSSVINVSGGWNRVAISYDYGSTANIPTFFLGGQSVALSTQTTPAGTLQSETKTLMLGNREDLSRSIDGDIAEAAVYNAILTADEMRAVTLGYSAPLVRRANLLFYADMLYGTRDQISGTALTVTGTVTKVDHPPVVYPLAPIVHPKLTVSGGGGGGARPFYYYQRLRAC